ncbi:MAG TPA: NADH-quinone oxidoreductase subunit N [Candidatus Solibacter sp.]|jgi:NADH-quinone oxidoreductase subunit N|nr:NADH-quinone oxidoreductase subunit N [Candidatus Solibacter sp.]
MSAADLGLVALAIPAGTVMVLLMADAFVGEDSKAALAPIAGLGLVSAIVFAVTSAASGLTDRGGAQTYFNQTLVVDGFSVFFQLLFLGLAVLVLMIAPDYLDRRGIQKGEFYVLLVSALVGMMLLVAAVNLITIFVAIELLSISLYILAAFLRRQEGSQEAGLKYLLIGGFASGFLLYGLALIYGATGSTSVASISRTLPHLGGDNLLFAELGVALLVVGLAFKASAAPFHSWTPDVYQGAPIPVVAFMSVGTKVAAIAVFLRIVSGALAAPAVQPRSALLLGAVSALSMIVGAVGALRQTDLKRMLAYSSIAQAGYLLLAAVASGRQGMVGGLFYLAAYGVMTFGAFGVLSLLGNGDDDGTGIELQRGIGYSRPLLGALLALFMLSLAGLPPTVGFMGKLFVFEAAIGSGYVGLTIIAIISSAIALYYYLRVVAVVYSPTADSEVGRPAPEPWGVSAVAFAGALTLLLGIFPGILYGLAQRASLL